MSIDLSLDGAFHVPPGSHKQTLAANPVQRLQHQPAQQPVRRHRGPDPKQQKLFSRQAAVLTLNCYTTARIVTQKGERYRRKQGWMVLLSGFEPPTY